MKRLLNLLLVFVCIYVGETVWAVEDGSNLEDCEWECPSDSGFDLKEGSKKPKNISICVGDSDALPTADEKAGEVAPSIDQGKVNCIALDGGLVKSQDTTAKTSEIKWSFSPAPDADTPGKQAIKLVGTLTTVEGCTDTVEYPFDLYVCGPVSSVTFGPVTVSFDAPVDPTDHDDEGWCKYSSSKAHATLKMLNDAGINAPTKAAELPDGLSVTWWQKGSEFKDVGFEWTKTKDIGDYQGFKAELQPGSLQISNSGTISGKLEVKVSLAEEKKFKEIAYLQPGLTGSFSYTFAGSTSFDGSWDFSGISKFVVHLKKDGKKIGEISAKSFTKDGLIDDAEFTAVNTEFDTKGCKAVMNSIEFSMDYHLGKKELTFNSGKAKMTISKIKNTNKDKGKIVLELDVSDSDISGKATFKDLTAFGCVLSGTLEMEITTALDLTFIKGTNIAAKHTEFEQSFEGVSFEVSNGELATFQLKSATLKYKKIEFTFSNVSYVKDPGTLKFSCKINLPKTEIVVVGFEIDVDGGIDLEKATVSFKNKPVEVVGSVAWKDYEFDASLDGKIGKKLGVKCRVVIGAKDFNYTYISLAVKTPGVVLGNSGLKLNTLSGEFGYNWSVTKGGGNGQATQGSTVIGFGLGIGDVANLAQLDGKVLLQLDGGTTLIIEGALKVPASNPYFQGDLKVTYDVDKEEVEGSITSMLKLPANGDILNMQSGAVNFAIKDYKWSAAGPAIGGKLFDVIGIRAAFDLSAPMNTPTKVTGTASGTFGYDVSFEENYPAGFDGTDCPSADDTDGWGGFGFKGTLNVKIWGDMSVNVTPDNFTGTLSGAVNGNGTLRVKWPCTIWCGDDCIKDYSGSVSGNMNITKESDNFRIKGKAILSYNGKTYSGDVNYLARL